MVCMFQFHEFMPLVDCMITKEDTVSGAAREEKNNWKVEKEF